MELFQYQLRFETSTDPQGWMPHCRAVVVGYSADGGIAKECENGCGLAIISILTADRRKLKLVAKCFTAKGAKIAKTMLP